MNAYFFRFGKKVNSTRIPETSAGLLFEIQLKDEASILNPIIRTARNDARLFNYVYIPTYQRYYYIDNWTYQNGVWQADLSCDVLGSYKTQIGAMSCYVERAASSYNGDIIDTLYPAKTNFNNRKISLTCSWLGVAPSGGTYVVGVINGVSANRIGAVTYYALTPVTFNSFVSKLLSDAFITDMGVTDISTELLKSLFKPLEYITTCMWFPFDITSIASSQSANIKFGYWDTSVSGQIVNSIAQQTWVTANIPAHPQAASRGSFLNYAPYSRLTLYIPPFGSIPIDTSYLAAGRHLEAPVYVDHITGKADIFINFNSGNVQHELTGICASRTAQFGVPISLGQVIQDVLGAGISAVGTIGAAFSGNLSGMISGAMSAIQSFLPQESNSGCNGAFIQSIENYVAVLQCVNLADENLADFGRPTFATKTINTLSGYVKCAEAHPAIESALSSELKQIESYMLGGFFWE